MIFYINFLLYIKIISIETHLNYDEFTRIDEKRELPKFSTLLYPLIP